MSRSGLVRELWQHAEVTPMNNTLTANVPGGAAVLYTVSPPQPVGGSDGGGGGRWRRRNERQRRSPAVVVGRATTAARTARYAAAPLSRGVQTVTRLRPPRLEAYRASSVALNSCSQVVPAEPNGATPTEQVTCKVPSSL